MYHSLTIGGKNTYSDWHLVPDGRPVINPPSLKIVDVDVPGANGTLDLSQALTGYALYNMREGTINFHVLNKKPMGWASLYSTIANFLSGKTLNVYHEDDPNWYYKGKMYIDSWIDNNDGTWSDISLGYKFQPYKFYKNATTINVADSGGTSYTLLSGSNTSQPVIAYVTNSSGNTSQVRFSNSELGVSNRLLTIPSGTNKAIPGLVVSNMSGSNTCTIQTVSGATSNYTIKFNRGSL